MSTSHPANQPTDETISELADKLIKIVPEADDPTRLTDPSRDLADKISSLMVDSLREVAGLSYGDSYRLLRTLYWGAWNEGWEMGYNSGKQAPR